MISNIDLLMNPTKPYYMDNTNMLAPLIKINLNDLYMMVENFTTFVSHFVASIISLFNLTSKDIIKVGTKYISKFYNNSITNNETQLVILIAAVFVIAFILDKVMVCYMYHTSVLDAIEKMNKEISTLKKHDRMRDNDWEILMQNNGLSYKNLRNEMLDNFKDTNKQFKRVDKQFKKIDKELTMYE